MSPRSTSFQQMQIPLDIPGYSVSLWESSDGASSGAAITLSASANLDVGPTPYWLEIYDATTGGVVGRCGYGTSCSVNITQYGPTTRNYVAYIGSYSDTNPPATVAATSNTVTCTWFTLSLSANPLYLGAGQTSTITASVQPDVGPTPYWLGVYDASTGGSVAVCGNGTSCGGSVTVGSGTVHSFVAYVAGYGTTNPPPNVHVTSNTVNVVWYSVSLGASLDRLAPGGTTTLTAYASYDVLPSPFYISIFDYTTNARLASCASGTTCGVNVQQTSSTIRDYIAYIGNNSPTLPPSPVANSNIARVTWISISLYACDAAISSCTPNGGAPYFLAPGTQLTLTAISTLDVGPTAYLIQIYDQTAGSFLFQCAAGTTCNTRVTQPGATIHNFIAYVNCCGTTYQPPDPRANSNSVKVTWLKVDLYSCTGTVSICNQPSTNSSGTVAGSPITFTAVANDDVRDSPYSLMIYDRTTQQLLPSPCGSGSSCTSSYSAPAAGTHTFQAYLSSPATPQNPVVVSSVLLGTWVINCTSNNSCDPTTFADNIFVYGTINAPVTGPNEYAMQRWELQEGGGGGCPGQPRGNSPWPIHADGTYGPAGNPINTTQYEPGSTNWNSIGVKIYQDYAGQTCWYWGVKANGDTLLNGYYATILSALRNPAADNYTQCVNLKQAVTGSVWGTHGWPPC